MAKKSESPPATTAIITQEEATWTREQVELLKRTICKGATDDEFQLFGYVCKRTGLDPFARQVYAVKRNNSATGQQEMSIQTGIDGYRLIADRTGKYAGSDEPQFGAADKDGHPVSATVTVYKLVEGQRCPFTATARWSEYRQTKKDGHLTSFWSRMPFGQLAKCAEALALRKAFPADLSGLLTHEEMEQADNETPAPVAVKVAAAVLKAKAKPPSPSAEKSKTDPPIDISKLGEDVQASEPLVVPDDDGKVDPANGIKEGDHIKLEGHLCAVCTLTEWEIRRARPGSTNAGRLYLACLKGCKNPKRPDKPSMGGFVDEVMPKYLAAKGEVK